MKRIKTNSESVMRSQSFQDQSENIFKKMNVKRSRFFIKFRSKKSVPSIDLELISEGDDRRHISHNDISDLIYIDADPEAIISHCDDVSIVVPDNLLSYTKFSDKNCSNSYNGASRGHVIGRLFRRLRKFSLGWRKTKCKDYRGDFVNYY